MSATLLADLGNSRLKWAWLDRAGIRPEYAAYGKAGLTAVLDRLWADLPRPQSVWLASVSEQTAQLSLWVREHWGLEVQLAVSGPCCGDLRNGYREPERLGVDRWLAMIGARAACPGQALCVLDLGTAVTLDIVDASGQHLGGYIMPGLSMMRDCLNTRTGLVSGEGIGDEPGRDTAAAIGLGTRNAVLGLLLHAIAVCRSRQVEDPQILLTGGDAHVLASALQLPHEQRPALVLEGLAELAKQGTQKPCAGSSAS